MLDVEPSNRPTAVQILNHAWMKSSNQPNTHLFTKEKASSDVKVKICQRKQRDKINAIHFCPQNAFDGKRKSKCIWKTPQILDIREECKNKKQNLKLLQGVKIKSNIFYFCHSIEEKKQTISAVSYTSI